MAFTKTIKKDKADFFSFFVALSSSEKTDGIHLLQPHIYSVYSLKKRLLAICFLKKEAIQILFKPMHASQGQTCFLFFLIPFFCIVCQLFCMPDALQPFSRPALLLSFYDYTGPASFFFKSPEKATSCLYSGQRTKQMPHSLQQLMELYNTVK